MPDINLTDPDLRNYIDHAEISIQVSPDGFSFCMKSADDHMVRAFRLYKFAHAVLQEDILNQCHDILHKDELLRLSFEKVSVCYFSRKSTLVPISYSDPGTYKRILEFNLPIDELDEIHANELTACDARLIFTVPSYFAGLVASKFKQINYCSQATPMILESLRESESLNALISIQVNKEFFEIVIISDGMLRLYNSFLYVNSTDFLYFILYTCKQLDIRLDQVPVLLMGEYAEDDNIIRELKPYITGRERVPKEQHFQLDQHMKKVNTKRYFTLLNLDRCE